MRDVSFNLIRVVSALTFALATWACYRRWLEEEEMERWVWRAAWIGCATIFVMRLVGFFFTAFDWTDHPDDFATYGNNVGFIIAGLVIAGLAIFYGQQHRNGS